MPIEQIIVLAIVQGITEFLPISSSGHLILVPALTGWTDQGLATDIMVHVGSLFAILVYFWRDVLRLLAGTLDLVRRQWTVEARLAFYIAAATVPAVLFGVFWPPVYFTRSSLERMVMPACTAFTLPRKMAIFSPSCTSSESDSISMGARIFNPPPW